MELKHRFDSQEKFETALKLAALAFPYYFCKMRTGGAYYLVKKDTYHSDMTVIPTIHATSNVTYHNGKNNIEWVKWQSIPDNYKTDMLSLVPEVREYFGNLYDHTSQNQNMSFSDKLSSRVLATLANARGSLVSIANDGQSVKVYPSNYVAQPLTTEGFKSSERTNPYNSAYTAVDHKATAVLSNNNTNNTNNSMSFLNNIPGLQIDFGKFNSDAIALGFDMQPVFKTKQGGYAKVIDGKILEYQGDLKFDFDFYRVPVPAAQLAVGDIVLESGQLLIVDETAKGGIKFINPLTGNKSSTLVKTNLLGMYFYIKIVSLFALGGDGQAQGFGLSGLNPMMLMLLSQKGEGVNSSKDLLPILLMSGGLGGAANGGINPMMLMMLSGDKGGSGLSDMLPLMLMSQSQGGANPFANLFGAQPAAAPKKAAAAPKKAAKKVPAKRVLAAANATSTAAGRKRVNRATPADKSAQ